MTDVYATANGSFSLLNNTLTYNSGISLVEVVPTGAPSPWDNTNQNFVAITGADGVYELTACGQFSAAFAGSFLGQFVVNGTTIYNGMQCEGNGAGSGPILNCIRHIRLAAGDTVKFRARQVSGGTLTLAVEELTFRWLRA